MDSNLNPLGSEEVDRRAAVVDRVGILAAEDETGVLRVFESHFGADLLLQVVVDNLKDEQIL